MSTEASANLSGALWDTIATIRDAYPRDPHDADTDEIVAAVVSVFAAELRRLAAELDVVREDMRATDDRTIRSSGLGEGIRRMRLRADEIDRASA